MPLRSFANF